jgi:hypothetical protein
VLYSPVNPGRFTQRAVGGECRADAGDQRIEGGDTVGALHDRLDLGGVLVVVGERRERDLRLPWLAVAQDQQALGRHALGEHVAAQGGRGQRREPRVQCGEDGFTRGGHGRALGWLLLQN